MASEGESPLLEVKAALPPCDAQRGGGAVLGEGG